MLILSKTQLQLQVLLIVKILCLIYVCVEENILVSVLWVGSFLVVP